MEKKRILILGAGVSGLFAAWHLAKKSPHYAVTLLEKSKNPGGWMHSEKRDDFLIEGGPRVFKTSRNQEFLKVVEEIGFSSSLIPSVPSANKRFLWIDGKLQKMPEGLFSFLFSSLTRPLLFALLKEKNIEPVHHDETIWDFACRRFGKAAAERFFDPLISGIYAGDIKTLSVESCLPQLKIWERANGSVIKGALSSLKKKKNKPNSILQAPLFSFKEGTGSFIHELASKIPFQIHYEEEILSLRKEEGVWKAKSCNKVWEGDEVIVAIPSFAAAQVLKEEAPSSAELLASIPYEDITTIHVGWKGDVLPLSAFGYLVPSMEKEPLLGVLFDTKMFGRKNTLMTIMVRGVDHSQEELKRTMQRVCMHHLEIFKEPDLFSYKKISKAIPQYVLGHQEKKNSLIKSLEQETRNLHLVGNYLEGVSVNDCIKHSQKTVENLLSGSP